MNIDEIKYLLAAHIIVTDGEINIKEAAILNKLISTSSEILEEYKELSRMKIQSFHSINYSMTILLST